MFHIRDSPGVTAGVLVLHGSLVRRAGLVQLARVPTSYVPNSYDDAQQLRATVCVLLDTKVFRAGAANNDGICAAFRGLRVSVARDLATRGDPLPRLRTVTVRRSTPAAAIAHRTYGNARRADKTLQRNPVPHPGFMGFNLTIFSR